VAWQEAITGLGTNGAGFRNADSAHPLEHLNPVGNLLQILQFLTLSASTCG